MGGTRSHLPNIPQHLIGFINSILKHLPLCLLLFPKRSWFCWSLLKEKKDREDTYKGPCSQLLTDLHKAWETGEVFEIKDPKRLPDWWWSSFSHLEILMSPVFCCFIPKVNIWKPTSLFTQANPFGRSEVRYSAYSEDGKVVTTFSPS